MLQNQRIFQIMFSSAPNLNTVKGYLGQINTVVLLTMLLVTATFGSLGCNTEALNCSPAESVCNSMEIESTLPVPAFDAEGNELEGMVLIPGGSFQMGIDEEDLESLVEMGQQVPHMSELNAMWWFGDELPRHTVEVEAFYFDTHEVINSQFYQFVDETNYQAQGSWQQYATEDRMDHPVIHVSWNDAQAYAEWAGKRLPSEQEWEYAARGGQDVQWFHWGDFPDLTCGNYGWRADETIITGIPKLLGLVTIQTRPVGCYPPNGYGLYDMCGSVSEWCENERTPYPGGPEEDWIYTQFGPYDEDQEPFYGKATRGGCWDDPNAVFIRISDRSGRDPDDAYYGLGFRCAKSVE